MKVGEQANHPTIKCNGWSHLYGGIRAPDCQVFPVPGPRDGGDIITLRGEVCEVMDGAILGIPEEDTAT